MDNFTEQDIKWQLIDIGCGGGEFLRYLINSRLFTEINGVDINK